MQRQLIELLNNRSLYIEPHILARFRGCRQRNSNSLESGGILMGRKIKNTLIIDFASTPGSGDIRKPNRFIRDKKRAQFIIDTELKKTDNRRIYLGEWHTHYEENPLPSDIDLNEWKLTFSTSRLNINLIICIIVGSKDEIFNLYLSLLTSRGYLEQLM